MKSITVLKIKIASKECGEQLDVLAKHCRHGRNAATENWLLRQRGLPESAKQSKISPRPDKNGNARPLTERTKLYHAVTAAVPDASSWLASMLGSNVDSQLSAKLDWKRGTSENGKRPRRRDAILAYEDRPPFTTALEIPLHNAHVNIEWQDGALAIVIQRPMKSLPTLRLPLSLRDIPPGVQLLLHELADGTRKLADSRVVYKDARDAWYWHVPIAFETERRSDVSLTLSPRIGKGEGKRQLDRPFLLGLPNGRMYCIGDGRYLLYQVTRLVGLRKMIGWRYRHGMGKGHGRAKVDASVRRRRWQEQNVIAEVRRRAICDVVAQCDRYGAGVLIYREPTLPVRRKSWFASVGLDWDWTRYREDLVNACARKGIEVKIAQLKWQEVDNAEKEAA